MIKKDININEFKKENPNWVKGNECITLKKGIGGYLLRHKKTGRYFVKFQYHPTNLTLVPDTSMVIHEKVKLLV